jgi:hypothetical protein
VTDSDRQPGTASFPWRQIAIVATVFAVVVAGLWQFIGAFDDTGIEPSQPTGVASPGSTEAVATVDATPTEPIATPDIVPEWPVGSLPAFLDLAPDRLADGSLPLDTIASYADLARWMEARGIVVPSSIDDPAYVAWNAELDLLRLPETLRENGLDPAWESAYGFSLFDVDQVLEVGQAPDYVLIMRGAFDPDVLQAAWVASGYQPVEVQGVTAWSLTPGDTIDLSPPASRPAMGSLNNIVLLEDGTLIAAARTSRLGDTLRVVQGGAGSLAENDALAALLTPGTGIDQVATAVLAKGTALQATAPAAAEPEATPASATPTAAREEVADMPEVKAVLTGLSLPASPGLATPTASEPPPLTIMLSFDDLDAAIAGRNWIVSRYASLVSPVTGQPYADRSGELTLRVVEAEDDPAAIVIEGSLERGLADWLTIVADRDLGFAGWSPPGE